jgi:hypothetical protein
VSPRPARKLRCAVYTRESSEEGLEQEFNSVHALAAAPRVAQSQCLVQEAPESDTSLDQPVPDGRSVGLDVTLIDHDHLLRLAVVQVLVSGVVPAAGVGGDTVSDLRADRNREGLVRPVDRPGGAPCGARSSSVTSSSRSRAIVLGYRGELPR